MPAQIRVKSGIAMHQKRKFNFLEGEIMAAAEEIKARQHVLFGGVNSGLTNKAKNAAWDCVSGQ